MSTVEEKIQNQKDVLETIEAVAGYKHAQFIRHVHASTMLGAHMPPHLQHLLRMMTMGMLKDLADAWGIDLGDPVTQDRITKDLEALRSSVRA